MQGFFLAFPCISLHGARPEVASDAPLRRSPQADLTRAARSTAPSPRHGPSRCRAARLRSAANGPSLVPPRRNACVEPAACLGVLRSRAGDEHHVREQPGRPRLARAPGRVTTSMAPVEPAGLERKDEPSAGLERVEPGAEGMRGGGVDDDGVGRGQVAPRRNGRGPRPGGSERGWRRRARRCPARSHRRSPCPAGPASVARIAV